MLFLGKLIVFILTLWLLILVHEYGHYLVAKLLKVRVKIFSIGFGRAIWSKTSAAGTEYRLAWLPLGGYVELHHTGPEQFDSRAFNHAAKWKRALIILAGIIMNLLLALILFWLAFVIGFKEPRPIISQVLPNSLAATAELKAPSTLVSIANKPVVSWADAVMRLITHVGNKTPVPVEFQYRNQIVSTTINLQHWRLNETNPAILKSLGIKPYIPTKDLTKPKTWPRETIINQRSSMTVAVQKSVNKIIQLAEFNSIVIQKLVTGKLALTSLSGPIGIFQGSSAALSSGFVSFIRFVGFISFMLAFINLIPIPGLDGSQLLYLIIEAIRGKPLSPAWQHLLLRLGIIIILLLLVQATVNDLSRLIID